MREKTEKNWTVFEKRIKKEKYIKKWEKTKCSI